MNMAVTVGYKGGAAIILADPSVPVDAQKRAIKKGEYDGENVERIELWTKNMGLVSARKIGKIKNQTSVKDEDSTSKPALNLEEKKQVKNSKKNKQ